MDTLAQINGFWQWRQQNIVSASAALLYLALCYLQQEQPETQDEVMVSTPALLTLTGLGKNELTRCRQELVKLGLIEYRRGYNNVPSNYKFIHFDCIKEQEPEPIVPNTGLSTKVNNPKYGTIEANSPQYGTIDEPIVPNTGLLKEPSYIYKYNNNNIYINNINNIYKEQVEDEKDYDTLYDLFESKIRPIGSADEASLLRDQITEYGPRKFAGAVLMAAKCKRNGRGIARWLETVLLNGDWQKGFEEDSNTMGQDIPLVALDTLFKGG